MRQPAHPGPAPPAQTSRSAAVPVTNPGPLRGWKRWLAPSLSDLLFVSIIVWLFIASNEGWGRLLADGDTGWHVRVGESILATGTVPRTDPFSFSKPGEPWFAWEWLSDVVFAAAHRQLGLKGVTLLGGILIALFGTLLIRYMIWRGCQPLAALALGLAGFGAASIHYLARPHLFTLVLLVVALWLLESDRRNPSARIWLLVPLTAVWTNLHGGFLALLACMGVLAAGSALEALWNRDSARAGWRAARRYAGVGAACAAASLLNPYGLELHRHMAAYLRSEWIKDVIMEFQSPSFRTENVFQFEGLMFLGLMTAGLLLARRRVVEAGWILLWAHLSLGSVRHIPIFVIVATPVVASEVTRLWQRAADHWQPRSVPGILTRVSTDLGPGFRRTSLWLVLALLFLLLSPWGLRWPTDFPAKDYPTELIHRHRAQISRARIFTDDQWADYLLYCFYPRQRVFFDGRSDFYGPEIGNQYIALSRGKSNWREILDRYRIDLVLSPADWPLASLLELSPDWRELDRGDEAVLYERRR